MHIRNVAFAALAASASAQNMTGSKNSTGTMSLTQALQSQPNLSNLTNFLSLYPQFLTALSNLTNITLLAPSNTAFTSLSPSEIAGNGAAIQALFQYHVLHGNYSNFTGIHFAPTQLTSSNYTNVTGGQVVEAVRQDGVTSILSGLLSNVTTAGSPVTFTGGTIHMIDSFLQIPSTVSNTAEQLNLASAVGALIAANLSSTLDSMKDITAFVPTDMAFQAISGNLSTLQMANLTRVLEYHVHSGSVAYSTDLTNMTLKTLTGQNIAITVANGSVYVNSAKVVTPDVLVGNGVFHVIDQVLNPMNATAKPVYSASTQKPVFLGASSATAAPFTSGVPTPTTSISTPSIAPTETTAAAGTNAVKHTSSSGLAGLVQPTGAIGAAAMFGAAGVLLNM